MMSYRDYEFFDVRPEGTALVISCTHTQILGELENMPFRKELQRIGHDATKSIVLDFHHLQYIDGLHSSAIFWSWSEA
jgi:hypothetical protein